jgi:hypothetical protein
MTFLMVFFFFVLAERIPNKNIVASLLKGEGNPIIMWGHKYVTNYNFWLKESQNLLLVLLKSNIINFQLVLGKAVAILTKVVMSHHLFRFIQASVINTIHIIN